MSKFANTASFGSRTKKDRSGPSAGHCSLDGDDPMNRRTRKDPLSRQIGQTGSRSSRFQGRFGNASSFSLRKCKEDRGRRCPTSRSARPGYVSQLKAILLARAPDDAKGQPNRDSATTRNTSCSGALILDRPARPSKWMDKRIQVSEIRQRFCDYLAVAQGLGDLRLAIDQSTYQLAQVRYRSPPTASSGRLPSLQTKWQVEIPPQSDAE